MKTKTDPATPAALLRRAQVLAMTNLSDSVLHRLVGAGTFPRPVPLVPGGRIKVWHRAAVIEWIDGHRSPGDGGNHA